MMKPMVYNAGQWHDFFVMVGGGAAALTGLVFVAMTLNLETITKDATHRYRAIGTLVGFTAVFIMCALALMGVERYQAVGAEWLVVATIAGVIYVYGYVEAIRSGGSSAGLHGYRVVAGTTCYLAQIIGSLFLLLGHSAGLYTAAAAMVIYFALLISGAWLLIVGVYQDQIKTDEHA